MRFIDEHASGPFFLEVAYNAAHWPFQVPDRPSVAPNNARFVQPMDDGTSTRADYAAILERADQGIGKILATLAARGLDRNTLVVFMNDNGGEWLSRNAPLFHRKDSVWEGGVRVPALMRWPGRIPAGRVTPQVGIVMDVTATLLAAGGVTVPAEARPDGINLLPILEGRTPAGGADAVLPQHRWRPPAARGAARQLEAARGRTEHVRVRSRRRTSASAATWRRRASDIARDAAAAAGRVGEGRGRRGDRDAGAGPCPRPARRSRAGPSRRQGYAVGRPSGRRAGRAEAPPCGTEARCGR